MATVSSESSGRSSVQSPELGLRTLYADRRAQFYPTTAFESRIAQELLLDTITPNGSSVALQTLEDKVAGAEFKRTKSMQRAREAGRAVILSTLHSYGDFLENAVLSHQSIRAVKSLVDTAAANDAPIVVLERGVVGSRRSIIDLAAPIVRFAALHRYASKSEAAKGFNLLRTNKNRNRPDLWRPGATKRIEDPITGHLRPEQATSLLVSFLSETSIRGIQDLVPYALLDQDMRGKFWLDKLGSVAPAHKRAAETIARSCLQMKGSF